MPQHHFRVECLAPKLPIALCKPVVRPWKGSDTFISNADQKTIEVIHSRNEWGAEVVYGDTDSLFVYLAGKTRERAFEIGEEIAETITRMNPRPIKLKFEKVFRTRSVLTLSRFTILAFFSRRNAMLASNMKSGQTRLPYSMQRGLKPCAETEPQRSRKSRKPH